MIYVVNIKNYTTGIGLKEVYIGRTFGGFKASCLCNQFKIGRDGDRKKVIQKYRRWLYQEYKKKGEVWKELKRLLKISKTEDLFLLCWCAPLPCHGDIIKNCLLWMGKTKEG